MDKEKELQDALKRIEKKYGKGSIMQLDSDFKVEVDVISTGSLDLDRALGVGGIPRGRVTEIFGQESSGKTTLCLSIVREAQAKGEKVAYIDAEHVFDRDWAKTVGIDLKELLISQPKTGEEALDIMKILLESKSVSLIVVDSVAALVPKAELEGDVEDSTIGLQARLMSKVLRQMTGLIQSSNTAVVFINQIRMKINSFGHGSPITTSGGVALRFYASVRMKLQRIKTIQKPNEDPIGTIIRADVKKNKVAPPFRKADFKIVFDEGLSTTYDILDAAVKHGIVNKAGAWIDYGTEKWHGDEAARKFLRENPKVLEEIKDKVLKLFGEK